MWCTSPCPCPWNTSPTNSWNIYGQWKSKKSDRKQLQLRASTGTQRAQIFNFIVVVVVVIVPTEEDINESWWSVGGGGHHSRSRLDYSSRVKKNLLQPQHSKWGRWFFIVPEKLHQCGGNLKQTFRNVLSVLYPILSGFLSCSIPLSSVLMAIVIVDCLILVWLNVSNRTPKQLCISTVILVSDYKALCCCSCRGRWEVYIGYEHYTSVPWTTLAFASISARRVNSCRCFRGYLLSRFNRARVEIISSWTFGMNFGRTLGTQNKNCVRFDLGIFPIEIII